MSYKLRRRGASRTSLFYMVRMFAKLLLKISGWTLDEDMPPEVQRCVMIAAPHTSNWDLWYTRLAFFVMGIPLKFTIKREWTRFPFGLLIKPLGGIGVDRRPKTANSNRRNYTDIMREIFERYDRIAMVVTPEGTRSLRTEWKTGFYYTALAAKVPITFGYLDYKKKLAGVGGPLYPTGDKKVDLQQIMDFYQNISPKYPELFSVDVRYQEVRSEKGLVE